MGDVAEMVAELATRSGIGCRVCGAPAACFGSYETEDDWGFACDECCGHGNEDGRCFSIPDDAGLLGEMVNKLVKECRAFEDRAEDAAGLRARVAALEGDAALGDALRASGITPGDANGVQTIYAVAGHSGSHRIVSAMGAIVAWLAEEADDA